MCSASLFHEGTLLQCTTTTTTTTPTMITFAVSGSPLKHTHTTVSTQVVHLIDANEKRGGKMALQVHKWGGVGDNAGTRGRVKLKTTSNLAARRYPSSLPRSRRNLHRTCMCVCLYSLAHKGKGGTIKKRENKIARRVVSVRLRRCYCARMRI